MNIKLALLLSLIAGLSTLIGSLFIFIPIKTKNVNKFITFSLTFSLTIMILVSLFDLIPEALLQFSPNKRGIVITLILPLFALSYFIIKIIYHYLNKLENNLYKLGILSMITLIMHNLPEGILTFLGSCIDTSLGIKLSIAIALHNIPEGITIAVPIYYATSSYKKAISKTLISGLCEPLGALLAYLFIAKYITPPIMGFILIIVSGIMVMLSIEGLFPEALKYKEKKHIILGFIIGILFMFISIFI